MKQAVFLVDCGAKVGLGHLSRMRTLALALRQSHIEATFHVTDAQVIPADFEFPVLQIDVTNPSESGFKSADYGIVDGLRFERPMVEKFLSYCQVKLVVDDTGDRPVRCDILLNHNIYADDLDYAQYQCGAKLLGPNFALIKPQFGKIVRQQNTMPPRILITFGGGETGLIGLDVARALSQISDVGVDVALGTLAAQGVQALPRNVTLHVNADMPTLMASCSLYIGALGVSMIEALTAKMVIVGACVADNQMLAFLAAKTLGLAVFPTSDPKVLAHCAIGLLQTQAQPLFTDLDGQGSLRVVQAMFECYSQKTHPRVTSIKGN
jgi:UDP-2,4-diacetamido-2,4,6-trideoxy-beta-L-altropyranose hydrolase